jgi:hypothetical protein
MRQFVCLRIAPAEEIKGSAFIFRVNGLKVVGPCDTLILW